MRTMNSKKKQVHNIGETVIAIDRETGVKSIGHISSFDDTKILPYTITWNEAEIDLEQQYDELTVAIYKEHAKDVLEEE